MNKSNDVEVELGEIDGKKNATINDRGASRSWSGEGSTHAEAATEATRKFLKDRRSGEYIGG